MDAVENESNERGEPRRPYLWHGLCLCWIVLVLGIGLLRHRSVEALRESWREGDATEQLEVLQALTQRADPESLAEEFPRVLATHEDPRLRELAFTNLFTRRAATHPDPPQLETIADPAERFRALSWLQNQTTSPRRFTYQDLDQWFAASGEEGR